MRKSIVLISVGVLNVLHGSFHIIQFIQSMFFVAYATQKHNHDGTFIQNLMENPIFALVMGVVGILTLIIGIKDYKHHKKCKKHIPPNKEEEVSIEEQFRLTMINAKELHSKINNKSKVNTDEYRFWE